MFKAEIRVIFSHCRRMNMGWIDHKIKPFPCQKQNALRLTPSGDSVTSFCIGQSNTFPLYEGNVSGKRNDDA